MQSIRLSVSIDYKRKRRKTDVLPVSLPNSPKNFEALFQNSTFWPKEIQRGIVSQSSFLPLCIIENHRLSVTPRLISAPLETWFPAPRVYCPFNGGFCPIINRSKQSVDRRGGKWQSKRIESVVAKVGLFFVSLAHMSEITWTRRCLLLKYIINSRLAKTGDHFHSHALPLITENQRSSREHQIEGGKDTHIHTYIERGKEIESQPGRSKS